MRAEPNAADHDTIGEHIEVVIVPLAGRAALENQRGHAVHSRMLAISSPLASVSNRTGIEGPWPPPSARKSPGRDRGTRCCPCQRPSPRICDPHALFPSP
jgi:hypothetical protein